MTSLMVNLSKRWERTRILGILISEKPNKKKKSSVLYFFLELIIVYYWWTIQEEMFLICDFLWNEWNFNCEFAIFETEKRRKTFTIQKCVSFYF